MTATRQEDRDTAALKALHDTLRENLRAEISSQLESFVQYAPDIELWMLCEFLTTANSWNTQRAFEYVIGENGLRSMLAHIAATGPESGDQPNPSEEQEAA